MTKPLAMSRVKPIGIGSALHRGRGHWTTKAVKIYPEPDFDLNRWRHEHGHMSIVECADKLGIRVQDVRSLEKGSKRPAEGWDAVVKLLRRRSP